MTQKNDFKGALDNLFHYHGYTSHHVGDEKQKQVWQDLKTLSKAVILADRLQSIDVSKLLQVVDDIYNGGIHRDDEDFAENCLEQLLIAIKEIENDTE